MEHYWILANFKFLNWFFYLFIVWLFFGDCQRGRLWKEEFEEEEEEEEEVVFGNRKFYITVCDLLIWNGCVMIQI